MLLQISGLMSNSGLLRNFTEVRRQISDFWLLTSVICFLSSVFAVRHPLDCTLARSVWH